MTESPKYSILRKQNDMEIRHYAGYIKAEVVVSGRDYRSAVENGFSLLAAYIFGNNTARQKIEMTIPVQAARSQKIAMTSPVTVSGSGSYTVAFIMPPEFTLDSLPIPKDGRVHITQIPDHQMAAVRFSGYFNADSIQKNKQRLSQWLEELGLETEGEFIVAGYNPPWVPGFLARNEVMMQIKNALA